MYGCPINMFAAVVPVGAKSNTFGLSNKTFTSDKILVHGWYRTFIRNDSPHPALLVKKMQRFKGLNIWHCDISSKKAALSVKVSSSNIIYMNS